MSAPTDKPRGRRNDPAIREADILDAAAVLFADLGYRATNLEHVARRLGVTRQALYYYFPKKHDILLALFDRVMSRFEHNVEVVFAEQPESLFGALLRGHAEAVAADVELLTVLIAEHAELREPHHPEATQRRRAYTDQLVAAYKRDVTAGVIRPDADPRIAVNTVIGAANMMIRWYDRNGSIPPGEMAEQVATILERGLRDTSPPAVAGTRTRRKKA